MQRVWSFPIGLFFIILDQLTKAWIRSNLDLGEVFFQAGFLRITNVRNTGAAFGLFPNHLSLLTVTSVLGTVMVLALIFYPRQIPFFNRLLPKIALGLVFGGTAGNLIDRLIIGYVTDFIDLTYWPAFNVADSCMTIALIIFAYSILTMPRTDKRVT